MQDEDPTPNGSGDPAPPYDDDNKAPGDPPGGSGGKGDPPGGSGGGAAPGDPPGGSGGGGVQP